MIASCQPCPLLSWFGIGRAVHDHPGERSHAGDGCAANRLGSARRNRERLGRRAEHGAEWEKVWDARFGAEG